MRCCGSCRRVNSGFAADAKAALPSASPLSNAYGRGGGATSTRLSGLPPPVLEPPEDTELTLLPSLSARLRGSFLARPRAEAVAPPCPRTRGLTTEKRPSSVFAAAATAAAAAALFSSSRLHMSARSNIHAASASIAKKMARISPTVRLLVVMPLVPLNNWM